MAKTFDSINSMANSNTCYSCIYIIYTVYGELLMQRSSGRCTKSLYVKIFQRLPKTNFSPVLGNRVAFLIELGTGHYLLGEARASKLRKSLAKKLWPTPIKGLKEIDPPKTQIKKL